MLLANAPSKLPLPFASGSGTKTNPIPEASQIGVLAGAASLTDGFPPLCLTPVEAGGVPPSGNDMNGILYQATAIERWANAGGGYKFDGTFAADSNVGGYPQGARVLSSDGLGYWLNTADNNSNNPEGSTQPSGWLPDTESGSSAVTMTSSNVTLTPLQWNKPIIIISGTITTNLNLIFPAISEKWTVINQTTGAYTITCKTASGTGVTVANQQAIVGDGTNIYLVSNVPSLALAYPVGSLYINKTNSTNPATLLGFGTWTALTGLGLVGVGTGTDSNGYSQTFTAGTQVGEYVHTLTTGEMPSHNHTDLGHIHNYTGPGSTAQGNPATANNLGNNTTGTGYANIQNTGGGGAHNNVMPVIGVYMWYRSA